MSPFNVLLLHEQPFNHYNKCILYVTVLHSGEIWELFQLGVWSTFLNTSKILLIYIVLYSFSYFFLAVWDANFNRTHGSSIFTWKVFQTQIFFFFSFFIFFGTNNIWTLRFPVSRQPWVTLKSYNTWSTSTNSGKCVYKK